MEACWQAVITEDHLFSLEKEKFDSAYNKMMLHHDEAGEGEWR